MVKPTLALMVAAMLATASMNAGDKEKESSCCAVKGEMDCAATYAKLNLTAEQKAKMDALVEKCKGAGCTKESTEAFMKSAEGILSKEQMATFKTECKKAHEKNEAKTRNSGRAPIRR
jgi:Spy/CpxP family protein refolding chaperone